MAESKKFVGNSENVEKILDMYREINPCLTLDQIAEKMGCSYHSVRAIVSKHIPKDQYKALKAIRYSQSKAGDKNPMLGVKGENHPSWQGDCDDGRGYKTRLKDGKRQFCHRIVMAEAVGVDRIPSELTVHHIDGNPNNNELDNLALCTTKGHRAIHDLQEKDTLSVELKKSTLEEALKFLTSK